MANFVGHAALPYPVKGARLTIAIPYYAATGDPTDPVTPDTEISKDGGTYVDCTEEETTIVGGNGSGYITLTGDELNCSLAFLAAKVASGPKGTLATLYPRVLPVLRTFTAAGGSATTIILDADASQQDDYYVGSIVKTTGGTGGGGGLGSLNNQARIIVDYDGGTREAAISPAWEVTPDITTTGVILQTDQSGHTLASSVHPTQLASQLDVANLALIKLGDVQILSFDEDTAHARVVKILYPRVVDTVLRAHKWRFAMRQTALSRLVGAPTWRYLFRYQLPTDPFCLKVVRTSADDGMNGDGNGWEIQGREILTDSTSLSIEYIARITDPQQWDALFLEAVTERLAAELAIPITNTPSLRQNLFQTFVMKVQEARTMDGFEGSAEAIQETSLTDVR
jgi:hypothetical protein